MVRGEAIRDRIVGLRRVRAGDLQADPRNWRICLGLVLYYAYTQVAIERWQNYTGRKAVKLNG